MADTKPSKPKQRMCDSDPSPTSSNLSQTAEFHQFHCTSTSSDPKENLDMADSKPSEPKRRKCDSDHSPASFDLPQTAESRFHCTSASSYSEGYIHTAYSEPSVSEIRKCQSDLPLTSSYLSQTAESQANSTSTSSDSTKVYEVWLRYDSEPEIEKIPDDAHWHTKRVTLDELINWTKGLTITHMYIEGDIPPLDRIAPHVRQLRLKHATNIDELDCIGDLTNLEELNLSESYELKTLPESIGKLKSLKKLNVSRFDLTTLPDSFSELTNLEELNLSFNMGLQTLPEIIGKLKSLKYLNVAWLNLTSLPDSINELTNLEELTLSGNIKLQTLSESIGKLKSLKKLEVDIFSYVSIGELTNLEELYLSPNRQLQTLPESIGKLKSLKKLHVSYCNITSLPDSTGELTNLEELDVAGNRKLHTLPDSIGKLKSLKKLDVSNCNLTSLPDSIGDLTNLEELDLSYNRQLQTLPESIGKLKSLKKLDVSRCNLTSLPESIGELTNLEVLDLERNTELQTLPESIGNLKSLATLSVSFCKLTSLPDSIGELTNLEELNLSQNNGLQTLPESIGKLKSLKKLHVSYCNITSLPDSIGELTNLEGLYLLRNKGLQTLPESIGKLKSLKKLIVFKCNLTSLPDSIGELTNLEELSLSYNRQLQTLPESIGKLKSLKKLDVQECDITSLPDSIGELTHLEELTLSGIKKLQTLSESIGKLKSLKKLEVSDCNLTSLPDSIGELTNLEKLYLSYNRQLQTLPESIGKLKSLKKLDVHECDLTSLPDSLAGLENIMELSVSYNSSLTKIPLSLSTLRHLGRLECDECESLTSPPYAVCKQGIEAVRKYVEDLSKNKSSNEKVFPAIVIGQSMAGKTSLVMSLQESTRVLTRRLGETVLDQATKVFKVRQLKLRDDLTVLFYDCGGQAIYHYAYQLTFRTECVVLLVIDINEFDKIATDSTIEAACQQTCMDWLAHLYIACPKLGYPIVALTHTDKLTPDRLQRRRDELIETTELLRMRTIEHEATMADKSSPFFEMKSFVDTRQLIDPAMVFEFSNTGCEEEMNRLKEEIAKAGNHLMTDVPGNWYEMIEYMTFNINPSIPLADIKTRFPDDPDHFILTYVHEIGRAMWLRNNPNLCQVVFHRIEILTEMIEVLFDHTHGEAVWDKRIREFNPFKHDEAAIEELEYKALIHTFRKSGIMASALLTNLLDKESNLPPATAIDLLKSFHIICGPIKEENSYMYIIPFFSTKIITVKEKQDHIQLKAIIFLKGLPVPVYSYSMVSAVYIDMHITEFNDVQSGRNGVSVEGDGTVKYLLLDPKETSITLITSTPVSRLVESWNSQLSTIRSIKDYIKSVWKAVRTKVVFDCSHCTMSRCQNPTTVVNPKWLDGKNTRLPEYSGDETFRCVTGAESVYIPRPLMYPCSNISEEGKDQLVRYIKDLQLSCSVSEQEAINLIVDDIKSDSTLIDKEPKLASPPFPTRNVYMMTSTRGRALVMNNRCGDIGEQGHGRKGSDKDYINMTNMLQSFGFIISHLSRDGNWTAKEIVEAVHMETELVYQGSTSVHKDLGMFILVMMSHGDTGTIMGYDGKHANLVDIYKLLSANYFPAMRGKPKLVILQACSGGREEEIGNLRAPMPDAGPPPGQRRAPQQALQQALQQAPQQVVRQPSEEIVTYDGHLTTDDLLVMKPSFEEHVAYRDECQGSVFIRALVSAFYRYACEKDVSTLSDMIQEAVRIAMKEKGREQVPITIKTFPYGRKLYLSPGVDMTTTNHPASFTSRDYPARTRNSLNWKNDEEVNTSNNPTEVKKIVQFDIVRNRRQQ